MEDEIYFSLQKENLCKTRGEKSGNPVTQTMRIRLDNTSSWGVAGHCKRIFLKWKDSIRLCTDKFQKYWSK